MLVRVEQLGWWLFSYSVGVQWWIRSSGSVAGVNRLVVP